MSGGLTGATRFSTADITNLTTVRNRVLAIAETA